jgi:hypothetical protein
MVLGGSLLLLLFVGQIFVTWYKPWKIANAMAYFVVTFQVLSGLPALEYNLVAAPVKS